MLIFGRAILVFSDFLFKHVREKKEKEERKKKKEKEKREKKSIYRRAFRVLVVSGKSPAPADNGFFVGETWGIPVLGDPGGASKLCRGSIDWVSAPAEPCTPASLSTLASSRSNREELVASFAVGRRGASYSSTLLIFSLCDRAHSDSGLEGTHRTRVFSSNDDNLGYYACFS